MVHLLDVLLLLGVELVVDVAHDLLQQVLHGDQAGGAAVLIHHDGQVDLLALHIPEKHVGSHRFRDEVGRAQQLPQGLGLGQLGVEQVVPGVQNAHNVIRILVVDGESGNAGVPDGAQDFLRSVPYPDHHHVGAVDHHVLGGGIVKLENVIDELFLVGLDSAPFLAQVHHHADLVLAHVFLIGFRIDVEQTQHPVGGLAQQPDYRAEHRGHRPHYANCGPGYPLGLLHGHPFGYQLTQHQGEVREDDGDQDDHEGTEYANREGCEAYLLIQPLGQGIGEAVGGEGRVQEAGQSDGDLDGGQEVVGRLHQGQQLLGSPVPLLRLLPQFDLRQGDDGDL